MAPRKKCKHEEEDIPGQLRRCDAAMGEALFSQYQDTVGTNNGNLSEDLKSYIDMKFEKVAGNTNQIKIIYIRSN